jgi:RHS repeat-associated protein
MLHAHGTASAHRFTSCDARRRAGPKYVSLDAPTDLVRSYFGARYYASRAGRFTTVDPGHVGGNIFDPQSWNAYAYARNNPLKYVDPTGTEYEVRLGNGSTMYLTNDQFDRLRDNPGAGISFDGFWDSGDIWINNGGTRYGSYRYYYGFSDAIRDAGNRAEAELKVYVKEMALNAATIGFFRGIGIGAELTTRHGAARIAGGAATRGGVLSMGEVAAVRAAGRLLTQADGAIVRVLRVGDRFNVLVEGERGIITTFKNLSQKSLDGLATRYGWK